MPENATINPSEQSWDDLFDQEYSALRSAASDHENVRGDGSREEICAGLLAAADRAEEIPDEYADLVALDDESDDDSDESDSDESDESGDSDDHSHPLEIDDASFTITATLIHQWVDHVGAMVDEAKIKLTDDGIETRAVDPANVGMVEARIDAAGFEAYEPNGEVIGVNVTRFEEVLSGAGSDDSVSVEVDMERRNMIVRYDSHEFTMALIDPDSIRAEPDLPDLDLSSTVVVERGLKSAIGYAANVSDHVVLTTDQHGQLEVSAEGDTDSYLGTFDRADIDVRQAPSEECHAIYSIDYLKSVFATFNETQPITVTHGREFPVELTGYLTNGDSRVGRALYMIAPRIRSS